jgi:hypothetical protein
MDVVTVLRELARYPLPDATYATVARVLVQAPASTDHPDATPPAVADALQAVERGPKATTVEAPASVSSSIEQPAIAGRQDFVRLTIRHGGQRTTACVPRSLFDEASSVLGSSGASEKVRTLYREAPSDAPSKSGWVQQQLQSWLAEHRRDTRTGDLFG